MIVIGAGPGGYAAAFYAAERGRQVTLVEKEAPLGGDCLKRGCIPSKAYLHATDLIEERERSGRRGITFDVPRVDREQLRRWKDGVVERLGSGISGLAKRRGVEVIRGRAYFEGSGEVRVETAEGQSYLTFEKGIVATGSRPAMPAAFDLGNPRVMTSADALELPAGTARMLIIGGGYIGMEMGTIYARLGTKITMAEALDSVMPGADPDLLKPVAAAAGKLFEEIRLKTKVEQMATSGQQIRVVLASEEEEREDYFDRVLIAVGRQPNSGDLGLENTRVQLDSKGFIQTGPGGTTADRRIFAIGDVAGGVMLAHKASREGRIAVDAILGEEPPKEPLLVPSVVFTDPEMAWVGLTEGEARAKKIDVEVARFPWNASGRALSIDRPDGVTKLILEPETERILGVGISGHGAGELIGEGALAIEMAATARDLAETIHPHPTLSETLMECAEALYGTATHWKPSGKASEDGGSGGK